MVGHGDRRALGRCGVGLRLRDGGKVSREARIERAATPQQAVFTGVVLDQAKEPLPGVSVVLRNETAGRTLEVVTDSNGAFYFGSLAEGLYRVEVKLSGFRSALVEHVPLKQSEVTRARVSLHVNVTEMITVGVIAVDSDQNAPLSTTFTYD